MESLAIVVTKMPRDCLRLRRTALGAMWAEFHLAIETPEALKVIDFKTAKSIWSDVQRKDAEPQGVIYAELARSIAGVKPVQLEFIVVTKTKTPNVTIERVDTSDRAIERGKAIMTAVWQAIQTGNFFPSPSIMSCPTCPYRRQCDAWTG